MVDFIFQNDRIVVEKWTNIVVECVKDSRFQFLWGSDRGRTSDWTVLTGPSSVERSRVRTVLDRQPGLDLFLLKLPFSLILIIYFIIIIYLKCWSRLSRDKAMNHLMSNKINKKKKVTQNMTQIEKWVESESFQLRSTSEVTSSKKF